MFRVSARPAPARFVRPSPVVPVKPPMVAAVRLLNPSPPVSWLFTTLLLNAPAFATTSWPWAITVWPV